jgi:hypothetical protein
MGRIWFGVGGETNGALLRRWAVETTQEDDNDLSLRRDQDTV